MTERYVYRPGHPDANENGMVSVEIAPPKRSVKSIHVMSDTPGYMSPLGTGFIDGRRARREDLKRGGCREVDPGERTRTARTKK